MRCKTCVEIIRKAYVFYCIFLSLILSCHANVRIMPQNTIQSPLSFDTVMYIAVSNTKQINGVHKKLQFKYTLPTA